MPHLSSAFAQNRAEESGRDVWNEFVVPPFFDEIRITEQTKALVIEGGRGCGKTTLLNYFSHYTRFSVRRENIPSDELSYIGLYHRADTNFLSALCGEGATDRQWRSAFKHYLACSFSIEVLESLRSLNQLEHRRSLYGGLETVDFSHLGTMFGTQFGASFNDIYRALKQSRARLATWVNNLETAEPPLFLPLEDFVLEVISTLKLQLPYLENATFSVFIDEYENLLTEQKKTINGLLKHASRPLLFNIAMKRNSFSTRETEGPESIQNIHDYTTLDLESRLESSFELFAAEILCFKLVELHPAFAEHIPIDTARLRNVYEVRARREDARYRERVISAAKAFLPGMTDREVAAAILETPALRARLLANVNAGLKLHNSDIPAEHFVQESAPDASVVCSALLNRRRQGPDEILKELRLHCRGERSRFKEGEWIHNNLFGVILQLYGAGQTPCPLYAGFHTFVQIAHGNLRHLLALVHDAFVGQPDTLGRGVPSVPVAVQAEVVRAVSHGFLSEVRGAGMFGNQLQAMALTLGAIFKQKQRQLQQSEPEINHFLYAVETGTSRVKDLLSESVKWSVLFEEKETKKKTIGAETLEYVLNPIFCGYFQISFRKKRSIRLSETEILVMFEGTLADKDKLVRSKVSSPDNQTELPLDL